jgi:hypothetical protein
MGARVLPDTGGDNQLLALLLTLDVERAEVS